jgi:transposase
VHRVTRLERAARRRLIKRSKKVKDPNTALRFIMIAKLGEGRSMQEVARDLACAPSTVVKAARRFAQAGEDGLLDQRAFNGTRKVDDRFAAELEQVLFSVPTELGWERPTWTRELLGLEMMRRGYPRVAVCTMGRALWEIGARLKAPRPVVLCPWDRQRRLRVLREIRRLAENATEAEPVFFEDEMDVHLNPKVGRDWMPRGHRRLVVTPGKNEKRFVAGALNAATGRITFVQAKSKASDLFCKLVWKLATEYRAVKRLHLVLDNYIIHDSRKTRRFLAQLGDRVVLHFLPPYCPNDNRIERVWLDLHANVTRNHRCRSMEELMTHVVSFLRAYNRRAKLNPSLRLATGVSGSRSAV